jgi:hypothetical protein
MKMSTGKVVDGKVVVEGVDLVEGSTVIVLEEDDEVVELTAAQEAVLDRSIAQSERGEGIPMAEMLERLRAKRSVPR